MLLGNRLLLQGLHFLLPTYYMAEGLLNALQNQGTPVNMLLDLGGDGLWWPTLSRHKNRLR